MEAKHTKGPWDCSGSHVVARRTGVQLASVLPPNAYDPKNVVEQANARLIAAAPELLAQLIALRDEYTRLVNAADVCAHDWNGMYLVDDAIAKATGQSR